MWERDVDGVAQSFTFARFLLEATRARKEVLLMQINEEYSVVFLEGFLCSIAVMDVPIQNQDALNSERKSLFCRNRDVIEDTKTHATVGSRVMAGRANQRKTVSCFSRENLFGQLQPQTCSYS